MNIRFIAVVGLLSAFSASVNADVNPSTPLANSVRERMVKDVESAHAESFDKFLKQPVPDLPTARAGIRADISENEYQAAKVALAAHYRSLQVVKTLQVQTPGIAQSISYDCVLRNSSPGYGTAGSPALDEPPPEGFGGVSEGPTSAPLPRQGKDVLNATSKPPVQRVKNTKAACPEGTIAMRRNTLAEVLATPSAKGAVRGMEVGQRVAPPGIDRSLMRTLMGRAGGPPTPQAVTPYKHRYAHAGTAVTNVGVRARLNVWSPKVLDGDMSLSQVWIVGGDPDNNSLQTVEAGWQVMNLWQTPYSALFVYSTPDNYASGCYATACYVNTPGPHPREPFQVVTNKVVVGAPITGQSAINGTQGVVEIRWVRHPQTGCWWLNVDGDWIGYYPPQVFGGGALAGAASYIDFGGETTGIQPTSEMGSGLFAHEGKGRAAFQSGIQYFDTNGMPQVPTLNSDASDLCYSIKIANVAGDPEGQTGAAFYFGGPGTKHFQVPPAANSLCEAPVFPPAAPQ